MRTVARFLVEILAANGVEIVFGIPGVHTLELYRGLDGSGIRHVTPRHEQGAGFMADGYARVAGRPGVCFLVTGPGITNAVTAIAQAYSDSVPMLVISTVNPLGALGSNRGHLHELPDQRQLISQVTGFSRTLLAPTDLVPTLRGAFALFSSARPRPVHLEIPTDLLAVDTANLGAAPVFRPPRPPAPHPDDIAEAQAMCLDSVRPVIIAGGGAARGAEAILRLAEALDAPVLMTANGRGILPGEHTLAVPIGGSLEAASELLKSSDLILALGTELGPTDFDQTFDFFDAPACRHIRVDLDPLQTQRGHAPDLAILADAKAVAEALSRDLPPFRNRNGAERARMARDVARSTLSAIHRAGLILLEQLTQQVPDAIFVGDSTQPIYAAMMGFAPGRPSSFFSSATGYGTLGYALPAAIGAALAAPSRPIYCVTGDGGLQFSLAEMGSAVEADVNLTIVLWNNHGYGEIRQAMLNEGIKPIGVNIHTPNFASISNAFGWQYTSVTQLNALKGRMLESEKGLRVIEIDEQSFVAAVTESCAP